MGSVQEVANEFEVVQRWLSMQRPNQRESAEALAHFALRSTKVWGRKLLLTNASSCSRSHLMEACSWEGGGRGGKAGCVWPNECSPQPPASHLT